MFRPIRELCPFANFNGRFASWFQFANGRDFYERPKYLAWLWIKRRKAKVRMHMCLRAVVEWWILQVASI